MLTFTAINAEPIAETTEISEHASKEIQIEQQLRTLKHALELQAQGQINESRKIYEILLESEEVKQELPSIPSIHSSSIHTLVYTLHKSYAYLLKSLPDFSAEQVSDHLVAALRVDPSQPLLWMQLGELYSTVDQVRSSKWAYENGYLACVKESEAMGIGFTQVGIRCLKKLCDMLYELGDFGSLLTNAKLTLSYEEDWEEGLWYKYYVVKGIMEAGILDKDNMEIDSQDMIDYFLNKDKWEQRFQGWTKERRPDKIERSVVQVVVVTIQETSWKALGKGLFKCFEHAPLGSIRVEVGQPMDVFMEDFDVLGTKKARLENPFADSSITDGSQNAPSPGEPLLLEDIMDMDFEVAPPVSARPTPTGTPSPSVAVETAPAVEGNDSAHLNLASSPKMTIDGDSGQQGSELADGDSDSLIRSTRKSIRRLEKEKEFQTQSNMYSDLDANISEILPSFLRGLFREDILFDSESWEEELIAEPTSSPVKRSKRKKTTEMEEDADFDVSTGASEAITDAEVIEVTQFVEKWNAEQTHIMEWVVPLVRIGLSRVASKVWRFEDPLAKIIRGLACMLRPEDLVRSVEAQPNSNEILLILAELSFPSLCPPSKSTPARRTSSTEIVDALSSEFIKYSHALTIIGLSHPLPSPSLQLRHAWLHVRIYDRQNDVESAIKILEILEQKQDHFKKIVTFQGFEVTQEDIIVDKRRLKTKRFLEVCERFYGQGKWQEYMDIVERIIFLDIDNKSSSSFPVMMDSEMIDVCKEYIWNNAPFSQRWELEKQYLQCCRELLVLSERQEQEKQRLQQLLWTARTRFTVDYLNHFDGLGEIGALAKLEGILDLIEPVLRKCIGKPEKGAFIPHDQHFLALLSAKLRREFIKAMCMLIRIVWSLMLRLPDFVDAVLNRRDVALADARRELANRIITYSWLVFAEIFRWTKEDDVINGVEDKENNSELVAVDVSNTTVSTASSFAGDRLADLLYWAHHEISRKCTLEERGVCNFESGIFHHYTLHYLSTLPPSLQDQNHIVQIYFCLYGLYIAVDYDTPFEKHSVEALTFDRDAAIEVFKMIRKPVLSRLHRPDLTRFGAGERGLKEVLAKIGEAAGQLPLGNLRVLANKTIVDTYLDSETGGLVPAELQGKAFYLNFPIYSEKDLRSISSAQFSYFYMHGKLAWLQAMLKSTQSASRRDGLQFASEHFLSHMYLQPREWEGWLWLGLCYANLAYEYSTYTKYEWETFRCDILSWQFKALKCFLQVNQLIKRRKYNWFSDKNVGAFFWNEFGNLLYSILMKPNNGEVLDRFLGKIVSPIDPKKGPVRKKTDAQLKRDHDKAVADGLAKIRILASHCFEQAWKLNKTDWNAPMMRGRLAEKLKEDTNVILSWYQKAYRLAYRIWTTEKDKQEVVKHYLPACKVISFLCKSLLADKITPDAVFDVFKDSLIDESEYILSTPNEGETSVLVLKPIDATIETPKLKAFKQLRIQLQRLRNVDSRKWHHKIIYWHSWLYLNVFNDANQAQAEIYGNRGLFLIKAVSKNIMHVWVSPGERPARHFHYIEKYMLHFIRILAQTQDIEALSAIAPRLSLREAKITFVNGETIRQSFAEIYLEFMRKEAHSVSTPRIVEKFTNARLLKKTKFYELLAKFESEWGPNPTTRPHGLIIMQKLIDLKKCDFAPDLNELNRMIISSFLSVFWTELEAFIRLPRPKLVTVVEGATDISPVVLPPVFDGTGDVLDDEFLVKSAEKMARVLSKTRRIKANSLSTELSKVKGETTQEKAERKLSRAERLTKRLQERGDKAGDFSRLENADMEGEGDVDEAEEADEVDGDNIDEDELTEAVVTQESPTQIESLLLEEYAETVAPVLSIDARVERDMYVTSESSVATPAKTVIIINGGDKLSDSSHVETVGVPKRDEDEDIEGTEDEDDSEVDEAEVDEAEEVVDFGDLEDVNHDNNDEEDVADEAEEEGREGEAVNLDETEMPDEGLDFDANLRVEEEDIEKTDDGEEEEEGELDDNDEHIADEDLDEGEIDLDDTADEDEEDEDNGGDEADEDLDGGDSEISHDNRRPNGGMVGNASEAHLGKGSDAGLRGMVLDMDHEYS